MCAKATVVKFLIYDADDRSRISAWMIESKIEGASGKSPSSTV